MSDVEKKEVEVTEENKGNDYSEKSIEELKAELESKQKEFKEKRESSKYEEERQNIIAGINKYERKIQDFDNKPVKDEPKSQNTATGISQSDVEDIITLREHKIAWDSDKAQILKSFKDAGLIASYAEGLEDVGIKAKFEAIDAKNSAHAIIDENADDESALMTKKEIIKRYQTTGEIPQDPKLQEAIAKENLKSMGF